MSGIVLATIETKYVMRFEYLPDCYCPWETAAVVVVGGLVSFLLACID